MAVVAPVHKPLHTSCYLRRVRIRLYTDRRRAELSKANAFPPSEFIKHLTSRPRQHDTGELLDVCERNSCCARICKANFCKIPRDDNVISEFGHLIWVFTRQECVWRGQGKVGERLGVHTSEVAESKE